MADYPASDESLAVDRRGMLQAMALAGGVIALPGGTHIARAAAPASASGPDAGEALGNRPWVYWYWLDANVTRAGILADLEAMHEVGVEGIFLFNINGASDSTLVSPAVESQTPLWWEMVRFAIDRAGSLGMRVAMNVCDGWGTAGGRFITPEQSAQELTWTETALVPGARTHRIARPAARLDYYRDVGAFAFPVPDDWDVTDRGRARITASWPIEELGRLSDPASKTNVVDTEEPGFIEYAFDAPFTLRSVTVRNTRLQIMPFLAVGWNGAANSFAIETSDDGRAFKHVFTLSAPKLGWQSHMDELTHAIPPVTARHFRFVYRPDAIAIVSGDGQYGVARRLQLASLTLSSRAVVDQVPIRSGLLWGIARAVDHTLLPDRACIDPATMIDVSAHLAADGTLDWRVPPGRWRLLRIGATTNGIVTAPSGKAGGLECDKFDPAVVERQFDGWFGEALRHVGPDLAGKVLNVLHIDSWEARSQNWSPRLAQEFEARRGYDMRPFLPIMAGIPIGSVARTQGFLFDLRQTLADLLRDTFFGTLERLAHRKGCLFSAQQPNATFVSDGMQHFQHVDLPCGEFWKGRPDSDKPSDVREAVSGARLYGKPVVSAEAFTGQLDWSEHPFSFKAQGDQNFCFGINRLILHVWAHQAFPERKPGITLFGFGTFFSETQPWWPMAGAWIDYVSRCQTLLQQGRAVVDLCYYTGEDIPSRAFLPDALRPALPAGYAYDSINRDALMRASVKDGRIVLPGGASYAMIVLPDAVPMTAAVARKLRDLHEAGASLYGTRPGASPTLGDDTAARAETAVLLDALWGSAGTPMPPGTGRVIASGDLGAALRVQGILPDAETGVADALLWTHREHAGQQLYFLSNPSGNLVECEAIFRSEGRVSLHDPVADRWTLPPARRRADGRTVLSLSLPPSGSVFVRFDEAGGKQIAAIESRTSGPLPLLSETDGTLFAETETSGRWTVRTDAAAPLTLEVPALPAAIGLDGPWDVRFEGGRQAVALTMTTLRSWSEEHDPAIRFHSGTATYRTRLRVPAATAGQRWRLDPGIFADILRVRINGTDCGILWVPGTALDVTDALVPGSNLIEILVANTWRNRLVGDQALPEADRTTWVLPNRLGAQPAPILPKDAGLLKAGLLGPVRLLPFARVKVSSRQATE